MKYPHFFLTYYKNFWRRIWWFFLMCVFVLGAVLYLSPFVFYDVSFVVSVLAVLVVLFFVAPLFSCCVIQKKIRKGLYTRIGQYPNETFVRIQRNSISIIEKYSQVYRIGLMNSVVGVSELRKQDMCLIIGVKRLGPSIGFLIQTGSKNITIPYQVSETEFVEQIYKKIQDIEKKIFDRLGVRIMRFFLAYIGYIFFGIVLVSLYVWSIF